MKRLFFFLLSGLVAAFIIAFPGHSVFGNFAGTLTVRASESTKADPVEVPADKIVVNEDFKDEMFLDETQDISSIPSQHYSNYQRLVYSSTDDSVASVSAKGKVTAVGKGSCYICITYDGWKNIYFSLTVKVKTEEISVKSKYIVLKQGELYVLGARVLPEDANARDLKYKSLNEAVAHVNNKGVTRAIAPGSAAIVISNEDTQILVNVIVSEESGEREAPTEPANPPAGEEADTDPLVRLINDSADEQLVVKDIEMLSSAVLKALRATGKSLRIELDHYDISIRGSEIVNPNHALPTDLAIQEDPRGLAMEIGEKLPGPITIALKDPPAAYQYFYLKDAEGAFQRLNTLSENTIIISGEGSYLLTTEEIEGFRINIIWVLAAGGVILLLFLLYILTRRKYWFW
ncbi:MAG: Ig-like domain-containing protein [Lachnospiraceae bacterium]|nr:Ig-like domain-containing protein [Lachnospiraceae bacterium]